jgi:hypothetical protein
MGYARDFLEKDALVGNEDFLDLDLCLLEQAFEACELVQALAIGFSVHASTLQARKSRTLYLNRVASHASFSEMVFATGQALWPCQDAPQALRGRLLQATEIES